MKKLTALLAALALALSLTACGNSAEGQVIRSQADRMPRTLVSL